MVLVVSAITLVVMAGGSLTSSNLVRVPQGLYHTKSDFLDEQLIYEGHSKLLREQSRCSSRKFGLR